MISCIVLAAGLNTRFGSPKALAILQKQTVIERLQLTLLETSCAEIIIVLGAYALNIQPYVFNHKRVRVVYNKHYNFGQVTSVQSGWHASSRNAHGIMILPVDCPLIKASSIDHLIDVFHRTKPDILIPTFQHKRGHPPIIHQQLRAHITQMPATLGINTLFAQYPPQELRIDDEGIIKSFNTPAEFAALQHKSYNKRLKKKST